MYLLELKEKLATILSIEVADFVYPPSLDLGHLSLPLFNLAKSQGKNPVELAKELAVSLRQNKKIANDIQEIKAVGPYLNFFISATSLLAGTITDIKKAGTDFGCVNSGDKERVMLEYSNANTHKEYHIGHLRNLFYGDAVKRVLNFNNYQVIPVSYINDFGIHVAKTLWNWQKHPEYAQNTGAKGKILGECYSEATKNIGNDEQAKREVKEVMQALESGQGETYALWQETRSWSIAYFDEIYQHFNIEFEQIFYESEFIDQGLKLVQEFLNRGILKNSQGAIIADLEEFNLGVLPIIRSDGTALYPVADLALARMKFKEFKLQESVYVVDIRQGLYFKQLAKIFELAGDNFKITHLGYDFVTLKSGMMSSRSGNVITYNQIWTEAFNRANQEVASRHADWSSSQIQETSTKLAIAALKFEMLKVSGNKVISFDVDEALRFEGFTAAYLQYTGARLASILRKAQEKKVVADYSLLNHPKEIFLAISLERFFEAVAKAGDQRDPAVIARYLFELAQAFNDYYHEVPVLKAEESLVVARLELLRSIRQVFINGFALLGFTYLEEM